MTQDPTLLSRVRKLLALAASPNVHEASTAAAVAQTLIARHRLQDWLDAEQSEAQDPDPIADARDQPLEVAKRLRPWRLALASTLADANGCVAYALERGRDSAIVLVGRARDREAVVELYTWLAARIEWLSATHGAGQDRQWHQAFRMGAVAAVGDKLAAATAQVHTELSEAALVRVDPAERAHAQALDAFVTEKLKLGRGRSVRVDAQAWQAGQAAGAALDLGGRTQRSQGPAKASLSRASTRPRR